MTAALANDTRYNFGSKTFWYIFSEKSITGFVFLFAALAVSVSRYYLTGNQEIAGFLRMASWFSFAVAAVGFVVAAISGKLIYKNTSFSLSEDALTLSRGVFTKEQFAIPYRQIQNIEIERTLGDQIMGLSRLIILTAGLEESAEEKRDDPEGIIPHIDRDIATALEMELLKRANIQKVISVGQMGQR